MEITASLVKELREKSGAGMLDCKKALTETNGDIDAAIDYLREKGISKAAKKADRIAAEGIAAIKVEGNKAVIVEVNSETDFVAKNDEFKSMVETLLDTLYASDVKTNEEALALTCAEGTLNDLIISKTATIGEKLSFRRFAIVNKSDSENFGSYIHMGGRIATLIVVDGADEQTAKDVAMHAAAMRPLYLNEEDVPAEVVEKEMKILKEQFINDPKNADKIDKVDMILKGKIRKYYEEVCLVNQEYIKSENKESVKAYVASKKGTIKEMYRFEVGEGIEKKEENFADEVMNQINAAK